MKHTERYGMGKLPVIMFPAPNCDERLFTHQIAALEKKGHEVIVACLTGRTSMKEFVEKELEKVPGQVHVIGVSLGAHLCIEALKIAPDRIKTATLISMKTEPPSDEKQKKRKDYIDTLDAASTVKEAGKKTKDEEHQVIVEKLCKTMFSKDHDAEKYTQLKELYVAMSRSVGADAFRNQVEQMWKLGKNVRTSIPMIGSSSDSIITLVVGSEDQRFLVAGDGRIPIEIAKEMSNDIAAATGLPVTLRMIPGAGHLPTIENPEIATRTITDILTSERQISSRL